MKTEYLLANNSGIKASAGLDQQALLAAINQASSMVLHAAIYNNFVNSKVGELIQHKLTNGSLQSLTIILLQAKAEWRDEFNAILRPEMSEGEMDAIFANSRDWCHKLASQFPTQIELRHTSALPLQPILLIGDTIFAGQYAHSDITSAEGLWLEINSIGLGLADGELQHWFQYGVPKQHTCPWAKVIGRYINECRYAKTNDAQRN